MTSRITGVPVAPLPAAAPRLPQVPSGASAAELSRLLDEAWPTIAKGGLISEPEAKFLLRLAQSPSADAAFKAALIQKANTIPLTSSAKKTGLAQLLSLAPTPPGPAPQPAPSVAGAVTALGEQTKASLVERRAAYATLIATHEKTIATLDASIAELNGRIATKVRDAESLLSQKNQLLADISTNQRIAAAAGTYGGLLAIFTVGASAIAGGAAAATALAVVARCQSQLNDVERQKSAVQSELDGLRASAANYSAQQTSARGQLDELRKVQAELVATAPVLNDKPTAADMARYFQTGVERDQKLVTNLESQIAVLQEMKARATGFDAALDQLLAKLKTDVSALQEQVVASKRAVLGALLDIATASFGTTSVLRSQGLPLAEKELLFAGLDLVNGDLNKAFGSLVTKLTDRALLASNSELLSVTVRGLLAAATTTDSRPQVLKLMQDAGALTPVQRELLTSLSLVNRFDAEPIARLILSQPSLTRAQAEAIKPLLN